MIDNGVSPKDLLEDMGRFLLIQVHGICCC